MKKISFSLRIGIIGEKEVIEKFYFESLKILAIESSISDDKYEFLIVYNQIPIKIKIFIAPKIDDLLFNFEKIQKLDVVIFLINLYEKDSVSNISKEIMEEFYETYSFQGLSFLVGLDIQGLLNKSYTKKYKMSRYQLERITKELNLIYCFEIVNNDAEINEIYNTIFDDFIIRFQYSSPELFEISKEYGKKLMKQLEKFTQNK